MELSQIIRDVAPQFVTHSSVKLLRSMYSFDSFGDSVVEYSVNKLRVRTSRDRSELIIESAIDKQPLQWHVIENVEEIFGEKLKSSSTESERIFRIFNQWFIQEQKIFHWLEIQNNLKTK